MFFVYLWASWIRCQLQNLVLAFLHWSQACVFLSFLHGVLLLLKSVISFVLTCVGLSYTGLHYLVCRDIELLLAQLKEAFTRDFKLYGSTLSLSTTVRVAWIRTSFTWRVWRMLCVAFKYLTRQSCTFLSDAQKMSAANFVNLSVFLSVMFISGQRTALVEWVLYSFVVLAPIIILKRNGHILEKSIGLEMGFVHVTFNLVFDLKINEPDR